MATNNTIKPIVTKSLTKVRQVLADRLFSEQQIDKILPRLHDQHIKEPKYLAEIVDTWNLLMGQAGSAHHRHRKPLNYVDEDSVRSLPPVAQAPTNSLLGAQQVDMNIILADIEPDLLLFDPKKLQIRHSKVQGLNLAQSLGETWLLLYNAPRGLYLQDWVELTKKIYYIEHNVLNLLYDKKEQKVMRIHPLVRSAASTEVDFDHIRTRYLFALRSGYKSLAHMYSVQMALNRPTLSDILLTDNETYLSKFTPFCTMAEYNAFAELLKNYDIDEDDAQVFERLADLNSTTSQ